MEELSVGPGGWARYRNNRNAAYVRFERRPGGRLVPVECYLPKNGGPLRSTDLQRFPLGRLEAIANCEPTRAVLHDRMTKWGHVVLMGMSEYSDHGWQRVTLPQGADPKLEVPPAKPYGDDFYAQVARVYATLAPAGAPAARIAEANDVPAGTAHRWVREARRRGFLGPGRAGKSG